MNSDRKYKQRKSKLIMRLKMLVTQDTGLSETDLYVLVQRADNEIVPLYFQEEVLQLVVLNPGKGRLVWIISPQSIDEYDFCPDRRIQTHRLIGKPALGPSPPQLVITQQNRSGFIHCHLN